MTEQPTALRMADALIHRHGVESFEGDAAAELRRLHAQRDALLEALKSLVKSTAPICDGNYSDGMDNDFLRARAAIKAVEENT